MDKIIRKAFAERTIQPSNSAWERLENQLEEVPKKIQKNWLLTVGYAASILLIVSVAFFINTDDEIPSIPNEVVIQPTIETLKLKKHNFKTIAPIEEAVVKNRSTKETVILKNNNGVVNGKKKRQVNTIQKIFKQSNIIKETRIASVEKTSVKQYEIIKKISKPNEIIVNKPSVEYRIKIDSDALLYAATHSGNEVKKYYVKYNVNRNEALKVVQKELQRLDLKIDAKSMLAAVEKEVDEVSFKRSFMRTLKGKVSGFAVAFSNRNN